MVNSPHWLGENIFPHSPICVYPYKGSQRTSGIFTLFSLKRSLLGRPGREGTSIPGGLLGAGGFAHCHRGRVSQLGEQHYSFSHFTGEEI